MNRRRQIEVAFEIASGFVFGSDWRDHAAWCSGCEGYVPMITIFTAATLDKTTCEEIFRRVETGELHHRVTDKGELLICFGSLLDTDQETGRKNPPFDLPETQPTQTNYLLR